MWQKICLRLFTCVAEVRQQNCRFSIFSTVRCFEFAFLFEVCWIYSCRLTVVASVERNRRISWILPGKTSIPSICVIIFSTNWEFFFFCHSYASYFGIFFYCVKFFHTLFDWTATWKYLILIFLCSCIVFIFWCTEGYWMVMNLFG